jgi:hypothetical protein
MKKWLALPEATRRPGAVKVPPIPKHLLTEPPEGGVVLKTYTRNMKRDKYGKLARIEKKDLDDKKTYADVNWKWGNAIFLEPMPDVMWVTEAEWKSLVPAQPKIGETFAVPDGICKRLCRYHLIDGTFGLAAGWDLAHVRRDRLSLTVDEVTPNIRLRVDGAALMATDADLKQATHGFDVQISGLLSYDPAVKKFTRFDIVAVGHTWGGDWEGGRFARPGKAPLGIALELAPGLSAADRVTPKGLRFSNFSKTYFQADRS